MAVYDQSYWPWSGAYTSRARRVAALAWMDLALAFRSRRTLLVVALTFVVVGSWLLILFIAASQQVPVPFALGNRLYREGFYNNVLFSMILMVLSTTVGASLIARDLRHRAIVLYLSRAIRRGDYLAGKFLALAGFLMVATWGPGLVLFAGQLGMGPEPLTFGQRLADLGAITLHSLIIVVPMTSGVLACSSLTRSSHVAGVLWASFYFSSWAFSEALTNLLDREWCRLISWMRLTAHLGDLVYPARHRTEPILACGWEEPALILGGVTVLALAVAAWRLRAVEAGE